MPRIRSLKPEHRQHRKIGPLAHVTYRLWIGMLLEADDEGRLVCDAEQLRVTIFGYHPSVRRTVVEGSLRELEGVGLIRLYVAAGVRYACFPSWHDHQKIDRKQPSKLPLCDDSTNDRRTLDDSSRTLVTDLDLDLDRKGSDQTLVGQTAPDREILDWLNRKTGKTFRPVEANLTLIRARLASGVQPWQLKAIVSRKTQEWRGTDQAKYLRPATLFNKTKCEQYLGELPPSTEDAHV